MLQPLLICLIYTPTPFIRLIYYQRGSLACTVTSQYLGNWGGGLALGEGRGVRILMYKLNQNGP